MRSPPVEPYLFLTVFRGDCTGNANSCRKTRVTPDHLHHALIACNSPLPAFAQVSQCPASHRGFRLSLNQLMPSCPRHTQSSSFFFTSELTAQAIVSSGPERVRFPPVLLLTGHVSAGGRQVTSRNPTQRRQALQKTTSSRQEASGGLRLPSDHGG